MKRTLRAALACGSLSLAAASCGPAAAPPVAPAVASAPAPAPSPLPLPVAAPLPPFDPVAVGMTAEGATRLCDEHLARARALLDGIGALASAPPAELTWDATLGRFDLATLEMLDAGSFNSLMEVAHPEAAVREAARACAPKVDALNTALYLDPRLAAAVRAYAARKEPLEGGRAHLLADTLRDFRRNGLELPAAEQQTLRDLSARITQVAQTFEANIAKSNDSVKVPKASLVGLPADYLAGHPADGKGMVTLTTDYPDYFPFVTYSKDRRSATDLYVRFLNRGGDANVKLLEELLDLRARKAKLLGYASWADYAIEPRMARTADAVRGFLGRVRDAVKAPAQKEYEVLRAEHVALGGKASDVLNGADRIQLLDRVRQKKYALDSQAVSEYFELGATLAGMLDLTASMYGIEFAPVKAPAWEESVTAYDVRSGGETIGRFYLDLYSRPNKYKHMATFGVRDSRRMEDGSWQRPVVALVGNFPRSAEGRPALLRHPDVTTLFHEFGHVLHMVLCTQELATYSGGRTVRDFVEVPSQMFEEWTWSREVLDRFARHYKTGAKIPDALFQAMTAARGFGRALETQRQLFLASLDLEYHARAPGFDTMAVLKEVHGASDPHFPWLAGTHFQSSFGHLIGYDAGYYGYQWALSLSRDVLTRFKARGMLDKETARAFREGVLAPGGGLDEKAIVTRFLGREPNEEAYAAFLRGQQ